MRKRVWSANDLQQSFGGESIHKDPVMFGAEGGEDSKSRRPVLRVRDDEGGELPSHGEGGEKIHH